MIRKMHLQKYSLFIIAVSLFFFGCGASNTTEQPIGGPCTYSETAGQAKIVSMNNAGSDSYNCKNNPVEVVFDFTPDDPLKANPATDKNVRVGVGAGANPSKDYIIGKGMTVGSTHRSIRADRTSGPCPPVGFTFPDINLSDYGTYCF